MGGSEILHIKDIKLLYLLHFCGLPQIAADLPIPARVSEFAFPVPLRGGGLRGATDHHDH